MAAKQIVATSVALCLAWAIGASQWIARAQSLEGAGGSGAGVEKPVPALESWGSDLAGAMAIARAENRQVLVYFTSKNIPPARAMTSMVLAKMQGHPALEPFIRVQVDVDEQPEIAGQYKVNQLPVFVVLDQGKELDRFGGFLPPKAFLDTLRAAADRRQAIPVLQKRIANDPMDLEAAWLLARKYARDKKRDDLDKTLLEMRKRDPENQKGFLDNVAFLELMTSINPKVPQDGLAATEKYLEEFPESEFADQVEMTKAQLAFQAGDVAASIRILEQFPSKYPQSPLAPQVASDLRTYRAQMQAQ